MGNLPQIGAGQAGSVEYRTQGESGFNRRGAPIQIHKKSRVYVPDGRTILTKISSDDHGIRPKAGVTLPKDMSLTLPTGESIIEMHFQSEPAVDEDDRGPTPMSLIVQVNDLPQLKQIYPISPYGYEDENRHFRRQPKFVEQRDYGAKVKLPVLLQFRTNSSRWTTRVKLFEVEPDE